MPRGRPDRARPGHWLGDGFDTFRSILSSDQYPPVEVFERLWGELKCARLEFFTFQVFSRNSTPLPAYALYLIFWSLHRWDGRAGAGAVGQRQAGYGSARLLLDMGKYWPHVRDELAKFAVAAREELGRREPRPAEFRPARHKKNPNDARDKWIYQQCCKTQRIAYRTISRRMKTEHPEWDHIESATGIRKAAQKYAERHSLPPPPLRLEPS